MAKKSSQIWTLISILEIILCILVIFLDFFIPTIVLLGLMVLSLLIHRKNISTMGFKRPESWIKIIGFSFFAAFFMQFFDAGVTMPIMNRLTGKTLDYSGFVSLQGNPQQLFLLLVLSWTLAALGEELAYRGYLQNILGSIFEKYKSPIFLTVVVSSILFGFAHTEQGVIGVVVTTINAMFFSWIKQKYNGNLWAAILTHGFYNSIGVIIFFFTGPIYGLW